MIEFKDLKIGDEVWYVPADYRHLYSKGKYLEVTKVGRKYIYVDGMKAESWTHNSYSVAHVVEYPYGSIYKTQEDYLDFEKWRILTRDIHVLKLSREQKQLIIQIVEGGDK